MATDAEWESKVRELRPGALRFAYNCAVSSDEAEDLCQGAIIKLWLHRPEMDDERLKGWLRKVILNQWIDHCRRGSHAVTHSEVDGGSPGEDLADASPTPEQSAVEAESIRRLLSPLSDPLDREIVKLRTLDEQSFEWIGRVIWPASPPRTAENSASRRYHRAVEKLRRTFRAGRQ